MVKIALSSPTLRDPEVALATAYAPPATQAALRALWDYDARLGAIVRRAREPMLARIRLKWWHDVTGSLATAPLGEPVLAALRAVDADPAQLTRLATGWDAVLDSDDEAALRAYADGRGGGLFAAAAQVMATGAEVAEAGAGWALIDLARHHRDPAAVARALSLAQEYLARAPTRWDRAARPLGMLTKLARRDCSGAQDQGSPRRVLAMATLALTGR